MFLTLPKTLSPYKTREDFMSVTIEMKGFSARNLVTPVEFDRNMTESNWKLIEDVKYSTDLKPTVNLELVEFLVRARGEMAVIGDEMKSRSKDLNAHHGQRLAEILIRNQVQIPKEWRQFYLAFPGTVWQRHDDQRFIIPYLGWFEGKWVLYFGWLGRGWNDRVRLVRIHEFGS